MWLKIIYYCFCSFIVLSILHFIKQYLETLGVITNTPNTINKKHTKKNIEQYKEILEEINKIPINPSPHKNPEPLIIIDNDLDEFINNL